MIDTYNLNSNKLAIGPSNLRIIGTDAQIGSGLFAAISRETYSNLQSKQSFESNEIITQFRGEEITPAELEILSKHNNNISNYCIYLNDDLILCCYDHARVGLCFASMANNPYNVYSITDPSLKVRANAKIVHEPYTNRVYLVTLKMIYEGQEIITKYSH